MACRSASCRRWRGSRSIPGRKPPGCRSWPKELAAAALDGLIRRLPAGGWEQSEIRTIVARLIELLPGPDSVAGSGEAHAGSRKTARTPAVIRLLVITLGAALLFSVLAQL